MSALIEWFDRYTGPKALNRSGGQWRCILGGLCPVTTACGTTPDEAVEKCRTLAKQRRGVFAEIERQDREAETLGVVDEKPSLMEWERK